MAPQPFPRWRSNNNGISSNIATTRNAQVGAASNIVKAGNKQSAISAAADGTSRDQGPRGQEQALAATASNAPKTAASKLMSPTASSQSNRSGGWKLPGRLGGSRRRNTAKASNNSNSGNTKSKRNNDPKAADATALPSTPDSNIPADIPAPPSLDDMQPGTLLNTVLNDFEGGNRNYVRDRSGSPRKDTKHGNGSRQPLHFVAPKPFCPVAEVIVDPNARSPSPLRNDPRYDIVRHGRFPKRSASPVLGANSHKDNNDGQEPASITSSEDRSMTKEKTQIWDAQRLVKVILGTEELDQTSTLQAIRSYALLKHELVECKKKLVQLEAKTDALAEVQHDTESNTDESEHHHDARDENDVAEDAAASAAMASDASCTGIPPQSPSHGDHDDGDDDDDHTRCQHCVRMVQAVSHLSQTCKTYQQQQSNWQVALEDVMGRLQQTPRKALSTKQQKVIQSRVQMLLKQLAERAAQDQVDELRHELEAKDQRIQHLESMMAQRTSEMAERVPSPVEETKEAASGTPEIPFSIILSNAKSVSVTNDPLRLPPPKTLYAEEEKKDDNHSRHHQTLEQQLQASHHRESLYQQQIQMLQARLQSRVDTMHNDDNEDNNDTSNQQQASPETLEQQDSDVAVTPQKDTQRKSHMVQQQQDQQKDNDMTHQSLQVAHLQRELQTAQLRLQELTQDDQHHQQQEEGSTPASSPMANAILRVYDDPPC
mmetsp:Transcript_15171/g.42764  ORF Transcript_15171/g.42764 Transcript_15171/m.42764 type:complete len:714 (+) Transcript_15171:327-2468(+)|eukprot:CAMPEP_0119545998 /NCGR_PEP_ID=MMETSP1352-20130426/587_1 /TAXON_ID=265584 /ORGANISM="Stauroneis constricta, Strain CCMP1120" /LENGTH=713 /DNA_ID=CAMNT_0007590647 /DNA_START=308 /DNA_END=2449 /DNA_ORIENTATION=-